MSVPFKYNFQSLSNKFPMIFLSLIFCISVPRLSCFIFLGRKRKPKTFGFENVMERGIRKIVTFGKLHMASKNNYWENNTEAVLILKRFKLP